MLHTTFDNSLGNPDQPQTAPETTSAPLTIEVLLWRMRGGDREAAAEFIMRYGSRIRRRIRGKLGSSIRRLFDSMDILSTLGRRLDLYVMSGKLHAANEAQLWTLLFRMSDRALTDKLRVFQCAQQFESQDSEIARECARRSRQNQRDNETDLEIETCVGWLDDPIDKQVFSNWVVGETYATIGSPLGLGEDAVRKRLKQILAQIKERFQTASA